MLGKSDPEVVILHFLSSKQHYSSLHSIKQIQEVEANKMLLYFKAYYNKQNYSLSGYFHDSLNLGFDSIKALPLVEEWLDTNNYVMCQCPSHSEEMIPIGVLCYSSPFLHREELKQAIVNRHEWQQITSTPPVFDIYLGDIVAAKKKTKMLFISSERSRQQDLTTLFKKLYDATDKHYPNGT